MKPAIQLICVVLAFTCQSCAPSLPDLFRGKGGGFTDAQLVASKVETAADGGIVFTATATAAMDKVGFRVVVPSHWELWKPPGFPRSLYRGTIRIESTGPETEAFVRAIAKAYGQKFDRYEFTSVTLTAISLQGDPRLGRATPVKLKIFYESQNDDLYAESFLNFDLTHGVVQFWEKDASYRKAVVGYLTRKDG